MADHENSPVVADTQPRKILFLGDERVGKTTFIRRFCDHYGGEVYSGTFLAFNQFLYYRDLSGSIIQILFLDLPDGSTKESRRDQYPKRVNLVVLCFSVDNPNSLINVWQLWLPEFRQYLHASTRYYLLGLKCDMREEVFNAYKIPVLAERAQQIHRRFNFSGGYLECSVEENPEQARDCMDTLIIDAYRHATPPPRVVD